MKEENGAKKKNPQKKPLQTGSGSAEIEKKVIIKKEKVTTASTRPRKEARKKAAPGRALPERAVRNGEKDEGIKTGVPMAKSNEARQIVILSLVLIALAAGVAYFKGTPVDIRPKEILNKACLAMDNTKSYRVRVEITSGSKKATQYKEIAGNDIHWWDTSSGMEQFYIKGTLYYVESGIWKSQKVDWEKGWGEINSLDQAADLKLNEKRKIDNQWYYVISYKLGEIKAVDYLSAKDYRYLQAITRGTDFEQISYFYDYDKTIRLEAPKLPKSPHGGATGTTLPGMGGE